MHSLSVLQRTAALALLAPGLLAVGWTPSADAAVETCLGQEATLVGGTDRSEQVIGTPGNDVIVTRGAQVWGGDGDDVICADFAEASATGVDIAGGNGDDRVDVQGADSRQSVWLGDGSDTFTGIAQDVYTDADAYNFGYEEGYDRDHRGDAGDVDRVTFDPGSSGFVSTDKRGLYRDVVVFGASGTLGVVAAAFRATVDGGTAGTSYLSVRLPDLPFTIDDRTNRAGYNTQYLQWSGFSEVSFAGGRGIAYRGTAGDDTVGLGGLATASMYGGDDELVVSGLSGGPDLLSGGTGRDVLMTPEEFFSGNTALDVARRTFRIGSHTKNIAGWESYDMSSLGTLTMLGSAGNDVLTGASCRLVVRGGNGRDRISQSPPQLADATCQVSARRSLLYGGDSGDRIGAGGTVTIYGGAGADNLASASGNDVINGDDGNDVINPGSGRDTVDGGTGSDTCRNAEVRKRCER